MKTTQKIALIILVILAILITYLGLQRDTIMNPPVVTGAGFIVIAVLFITSRKK